MQKQTEPGSAFLEYLEAKILKISPLGTNNGGVFADSIFVPVCPKNSRYLSAVST